LIIIFQEKTKVAVIPTSIPWRFNVFEIFIGRLISDFINWRVWISAGIKIHAYHIHTYRKQENGTESILVIYHQVLVAISITPEYL